MTNERTKEGKLVRCIAVFIGLGAALILLTIWNINSGSVKISVADIARIIFTGEGDESQVNIVMKLLASITIVLSIPTMIASFWGMNVADLPFNTGFGFWPVVGIAGVATLVAGVILWRKKMF